MLGFLLVIVVASLSPSITECQQACESLEQSLVPLLDGLESTASHTVRRVELNGADNVDCLNTGRELHPSPCRTIQYALQPTLNSEVMIALYVCNNTPSVVIRYTSIYCSSAKQTTLEPLSNVHVWDKPFVERLSSLWR